MTRKTKLLLAVAVLVGVLLACAVPLGNDPTTPLPPEDTQLPDPSPPALATIPPAGDDEGSSPGRTPLPGGAVLFQDDFTDPSSGWDRFGDRLVSTDYVNGTYLIGIYSQKRVNWANPGLTFGDAIIKVDAQKTTGGDDMQFGIICRHADLDNWYGLVISADGLAAIRKRFQGGDLENLTEWVQVPAISTGNALNSLQAECIGDRLSLFVNGVLAIEAFDSDIPSGDAGLLAGTFGETQTEVLFSNFVVLQP